jgi:hypothetical protein
MSDIDLSNLRLPFRGPMMHGTTWRRDGFDAPNPLISIRRSRRLIGLQNDIEDQSAVAGGEAA